ncbi:MAG: hypothetical protein HC921_14085 [Synechococcaceae cyanobacterium SM2_3_1]|nr:hypothetical protein [Synechococcaceae cyanobacterium SM2_3_1]
MDVSCASSVGLITLLSTVAFSLLPARAAETHTCLSALMHPVSGQVTSINDELIQLDQFPQGSLQAVILTNRTTSSQSKEAAQALELEFGRYSQFRQVVVVDGTGLQLVRGFVLRMIRKESPNTAGSPYLTVDFGGETVSTLKTLAQKALMAVDLRQQAVLFILDDSGQVLGLYPLNDTLRPAQHCLRVQTRERILLQEF